MPCRVHTMLLLTVGRRTVSLRDGFACNHYFPAGGSHELRQWAEICHSDNMSHFWKSLRSPSKPASSTLLMLKRASLCSPTAKVDWRPPKERKNLTETQHTTTRHIRPQLTKPELKEHSPFLIGSWCSVILSSDIESILSALALPEVNRHFDQTGSQNLSGFASCVKNAHWRLSANWCVVRVEGGTAVRPAMLYATSPSVTK